MKCPKCDGSGDIPRPNGTKLFGLTEVMTCDMCHGSGEVSEVEMTNEEWLRTCSTEEFAEWIASEINERVKLALHDSELNDGDVDADFYMEDSDDWKEWLKQPHSEVAE